MGTILLVRHAQASFGADDYDVLSELGWQQGFRLGRWLASSGMQPTSITTGVMRRHRETAEAILRGGSWGQPIGVDAGWNEVDLKVGMRDESGAVFSDAAIRAEFGRASHLWTTGSAEHTFPETWRTFADRVGQALTAAIERTSSGQIRLVVTSAGPIAAACSLLADPNPVSAAKLWIRFNSMLVNTSLTRVVSGADGPRLLTYNEQTHLPRAEMTYR